MDNIFNNDVFVTFTGELKFKDYGLNIEKNFLQAPLCECGCGKYANLILENDQDIVDFIWTMLYENGCNYCAIFVVLHTGEVMFGVKIGDDEDDIVIKKASKKNGEPAINIICDIDEEYDFHCIGLLEQNDGNTFRIVME